MPRTNRRSASTDLGGPVLALPYARISGSEDQVEGLSLDAQLTSDRAYAVRCQMLIDSEYCDIERGKVVARDDYQRLLARARELIGQGHAVAIIVTRLDRWGRGLRERVERLDELDDIGGQLHSVTEGGRVPRLVHNMLAVVADEETRLLGARVQEMCSHIAQTGWALGRAPNWGYRWADRTEAEKSLSAPKRVLREHPDQAPAVRELWQRAADGATMRGLVRWAATLPVLATGGRKLSFAAIRKALMSPVYVARQGTIEDVTPETDILAQPVGHWSALATDAQWRAVRGHQAGHARMPRQASGEYLLTGLIRCPDCGGRMCGRRQRSEGRGPGNVKTGQVFYGTRYQCFAAHYGGSVEGAIRSCQRSVHAPSVEADVLRQCGEAIERLVGWGSEYASRIHEAAVARRLANLSLSPDVDRNRKRLQARLQKLQARMATAQDKWLDGDMTGAEYQAAKARAETEISVARDELAQLAPTSVEPEPFPPLVEMLEATDGWTGALAQSSTAARRAVVARLVANVTPVRVGHGRFSADVQWTVIGQAIRCLCDQADSDTAHGSALGLVGADT